MGQWQADPLPKGDKRVFKLSQQDCDKISIHIWMRNYVQNVNTIIKKCYSFTKILKKFIHQFLPKQTEIKNQVNYDFIKYSKIDKI